MASTEARESTVQASEGPMAAGVGGPTRASIGVRTLRQDRWWLYPLTTFVVFSAISEIREGSHLWNHFGCCSRDGVRWSRPRA